MRFLFIFALLAKLFADQEYDVVVIGAGVSGIAAARELEKAGYHVVVLEARNSVGGRTRTVGFPDHPDIPVDLGAAWIQGTTGNPLIPLAQIYGAPNQVFDYDNVDYFDTTPPVQPPPLMPISEDHLDDLEDRLYAKIKELRKKGKEMSLREALNPWIDTFSEKDQYFINYLIASDIEDEYGADSSDLSLLHYDDDDGFAGPDNLMTKGYQPLINGLAAPLLANNLILLEHPVEKITYSNEGASVLSKGVVYSADHVICTVPLGVLKNGSIAFDPPLPSWKEEAIGRLRMGILDKTVLLFPYPFWDASKNLIARIPLNEGHWVETDNCIPFMGANALIAFNDGTAAEEIVESKTDAEVIASLMTMLRSIYGNAIPEPIDYVITRWGQDPYSFGSYSHIPPGATIDDYDTMAKPVGSLHFAGEATSTYIGTVHGAYMSGIRAAKEILGTEY